MTIEKGQFIDGRFRVLRENIGKGGGGFVHLAEDPSGRRVVIKFPTMTSRPKHLETFKKEYQFLLKFSHPNVARAVHLGQHDGMFFVASEFIEGRDFRNAIHGLAPPKMLPFFIQLLEGLEAIHKAGLLHLDVKSGNVLVDDSGRVRIIDFGIAQAFERFIPEKFFGTPTFIAPEMVFEKEVDARADLFSAGVLMYICVAGAPPFPARMEARGDRDKVRPIIEREGEPEPPSRRNPACPEFLDRILLTLLSKNPEDRFASARSVINALKTHSPEPYLESAEMKGAYLIPRGNAHIGRRQIQSELHENLQALLKNRRPKAPLFCITGEPGMGKTHLLRKLREAAEREAERVSIHYLDLPPPQEKNLLLPDAAFAEAWIARLDEALAGGLRPLLVLVDNADAVLYGPDNPLGKRLEALLGLVRERSAVPATLPENRPYYPGDPGGPPLLICLTSAQPPVRRLFGGVEGGCHFHLTPFTAGEIREYLEATPALAGREIPREWVEELYRVTAGNPEELKERLELQDSRGLLFDLDGRILMARLEDDSVDVGHEETATLTTQRRWKKILEDLPPREKNLLEWLAVLCWKGAASGVDGECLARISGQPRALSLLEHLAARGLLKRSGKGRYAFESNSLLPVLLYRAMGKEERQKRHLACARDGPDVLFHLAHAGAYPHSFRALLRLGNEALYRKGRAQLAKYFFQKGYEEAAGRPGLRLLMAGRFMEAAFYAGDYRLARSVSEETAALREDTSLPATLKILSAFSIVPVLVESHLFEEAEKLFDKIAAIIRKKTLKRFWPVLENFRGALYYKRFYTQSKNGKKWIRKARMAYERSTRLEKGLHPVQKTLVRNNNLGAVLRLSGEYEAALRLLRQKAKRLEKNPNIFIEFYTLTGMSECARFLRKYEESFLHARRALKKAQSTGNGKWILYAHHILAGIHQTKGAFLRGRGKSGPARREFEEALKANSRCLAASFCLEDRREREMTTLGILVRKGQCYEGLGDYSEAINHFNAALEYSPGDFFLVQAYLGLGESFLERDKLSLARLYLDRASGVLHNLSPPVSRIYRFKIDESLARVFMKEGESRRARACLREMRELARGDRDLQAELKALRLG